MPAKARKFGMTKPARTATPPATSKFFSTTPPDKPKFFSTTPPETTKPLGMTRPGRKGAPTGAPPRGM